MLGLVEGQLALAFAVYVQADLISQKFFLFKKIGEVKTVRAGI